jgi:hypothetical protein
MFHFCTCELHRDAATVAAALIGYDDVRVAAETTTRDETIVIDYFPYIDARLRWIAAPTLLSLLSASSGNDS